MRAFRSAWERSGWTRTASSVSSRWSISGRAQALNGNLDALIAAITAGKLSRRAAARTIWRDGLDGLTRSVAKG